MSNGSDERAKLDRLGEALSKDIDALSDDELLAEIAADGDVKSRVSHGRHLIQSAIAESGKRRLARARQAYDAAGKKSPHSNLIQLPLGRKKDLVAHFAKNSQALSEGFTLAARNEGNSEADLDSLLQDLLDLGLIDEDGNPR
jgi:hypothetical protein